MHRLSLNAPCPCGTGRKAKSCCGPLLAGAPAETPEALMRSRYTAYAVGDVSHLMRTVHSTSPHRQADARAWSEELRRYCGAVRLLGLTVFGASTVGDTGRVHFSARIQNGVHDLSMEEDSHFARVDGRWLYIDGTRSGPGAE